MDDHVQQMRHPNYAFFWSNLLRNCLVGSPIIYYIEHLRIAVGDSSERLFDHDWDEKTDEMQLIRYQPTVDDELRPGFNPYTAGMSCEEYCRYFGKDLIISLSEDWNPYPRPTMDRATLDLIPLLPNLRVLELTWDNGDWHDQLLALLLRVVSGTSEQAECNAFCKLSTVTLVKFPIYVIVMFTALPSMRYMTVSGLEADDNDYEQYWNLPRSYITDLELIDADIDLEALADLLRDGTPLESFAWNGSVCTMSTKGECLDQILLANAKHTLAYLEILGLNIFGGCVQLHAFTNLQTIIVSDVYLDFPRQPLHVLFPASVSTLAINLQSDKRRLITAIHSLLERKQACECLPYLTRLCVRTAWDPTEKDALRVASKAVGVRLVALKNSRHDYEVLLRS
ncbi:hypothetical protein MMC11_006233 [Xylographa trunciseda]|nr:hypothetical protein [Xylographa trunciseda]